MRLGMIGRADRTGVATQTLDVARHMPVDAILLLNLAHKGRGPYDAAPWYGTAPIIYEHEGLPGLAEIEWLISRCDVLFTVETTYYDDLARLCAAAGVRLVIHTNPELWQTKYARGGDPIVALPTGWQADRFPNAVSLPMPVDVDVHQWRQRSEPDQFVHVAAKAMCDRNGSDLVRACLPYVERNVTIHTRGLSDHEVEENVGNVRLIHHPPVVSNVDLFPDRASWLLLPRRYGGLSLTVQEAWAHGLTAIMLDVEPNSTYTPLLVPTSGSRVEWMAGGDQDVYECDPRALAAAIDSSASLEPFDVEALSRSVRDRAEAHSWGTLTAEWDAVLSGVPGTFPVR